MDRSSPITIVRIITRLNVGGPTKHVGWLSEHMDEGKWKNILIHGSIDDNEDDMSFFCKERYKHIYHIPHMIRSPSIINDIKSVISIFHILRKHKPAIIHTHTAKAGMIGRVAALIYKVLFNKKVKVVHTYHGHSFHGYFSKLAHKFFLFIERFLARFASNAIITISNQQHREILYQYKVGTSKKHHIIPLGIDTSFSLQLDKVGLRRDFNIKDEHEIFGIVGRIAPIKNHVLFIESIAIFNKLYPQHKCHFVIIGEGSENEVNTIKKKKHELNIKNLTLAGNQNDQKYFYGSLDYLVLTSKNEGTPVSILEAFAAQIPVISTPAGGVVDLLGDNERGIITLANAEDLAKKYNEILTIDTEQKVNASKKFVEKNYSLDRLTDDISSLYLELLGQTK